MQPGNKFFDDMGKLMTNAMGVAQGAKTEAETAMKGFVDRWMADRDFVTREEFDAVRLMAQKAREENAALAARIAPRSIAPAPKPQARTASPTFISKAPSVWRLTAMPATTSNSAITMPKPATRRVPIFMLERFIFGSL